MLREFQSLSDHELAGKIQAGSMAAFEELVFRYEHRIYAFAATFCVDARDAREVTQDTFVKAFRAMARFDSQRGFGPWLFAIARRTGIDRHRTAAPAAGGPLPELADERDPFQLLASREESKELWELARRTLAAVSFQALWLRYAEELPVAEVARVLGKTRVHVKVLLFRARQRLALAVGEAPALERAPASATVMAEGNDGRAGNGLACPAKVTCTEI